jgi:hypothetical protein
VERIGATLMEIGGVVARVDPYYSPYPPDLGWYRHAPAACEHCWCWEIPSSGKSLKPHLECCRCGAVKLKQVTPEEKAAKALREKHRPRVSDPMVRGTR